MNDFVYFNNVFSKIAIFFNAGGHLLLFTIGGLFQQEITIILNTSARRSRSCAVQEMTED